MQYHPTVLLIDDDTDDQEIFSHAMSKANRLAKCVFADDGIHALEQLGADPDFIPDFIFIDMNMPRMNGQQCLAELKKISRLKDVPVYMYSTSADPDSLEENRRLGALDFIVKPSDIQELVNILRRIVTKPVFAVLMMLCAMHAAPENAAGQDTLSSIRDLKKLSVEELMNIVVISVTKTPENLSEVASAIQVVTGNDIRRSTALTLPQALRLAPNLQVMQSGSRDWGVSARGFVGSPVQGSSLANKLLVMIDDRTVYTPLFGGVFWDVQNVFLEDVNRIEVVSGPGGTLWGSNAVNGVVNIMTKSASETQGLFASATYGSFIRDHLALRYGGQFDSAFYFRVYGQHFDGENSLLPDNMDAGDSWERTVGGFRADFTPRPNQTYTIQGEIYTSEENDTLSTQLNGQHVIAKWTNSTSAVTGTHVQAYIDRTYRNIRSSPFIDELITLDLEVQQQFPVGLSNTFLVGAGYRLQDDKTEGGSTQFDPANRKLDLISGFIQDQIFLIPERLSLTIGTKLLHNDYTGFEVQPSVRLAYINDKSTCWGAVSRAVRTPSRLDRDLTVFSTAVVPDFFSEEVIAYELGFRWRPYQTFSISFATYLNQYYNLRTFNSSELPGVPYYFGNDMEATSWGLEVSGTALVSDWWRIRGGYTFLQKDFSIRAVNVIPNSEFLEAIDPQHVFLIHSIMDISRSFGLDVTFRYVDQLPAVVITNTPEVPSYINLNAKLGWDYKFLNISIGGQNLLKESQREFGNLRIPRSVFASIKLRV